ncbi:hypothetical protein LTR64_007071 [Lithohypha guttulata]|uniref:uncharacterized protein n=1 Tax=Lithohypha guttulata TaxID=1690604 RepID=UPI002DDE6822|nr:hypothetical protein LTR51_004373 [Lithohypha guttulata]
MKTVHKQLHSTRRGSRHEHYHLSAFFRFWYRRLLTNTSASASLAALIILVLGLAFWPKQSTLRPTRRCQSLEFDSNTSSASDNTSNLYHPFAPITLDNSNLAAYRQPDVIDTFANYKFRQHPRCNISSLSLHKPFSPLCPDRQSFLRAFSGGGRIGFDAPYMPRDCDMRWYSTEEVCEIFSRFEKVIVVGDSLIRHVVGALNVLLRKDLGYGAVTGWNFGEEESQKCFCTHQMDVKACSVQGIYRTSDVLLHDPDSFACPHGLVRTADGKQEMASPVNLVVELMLKFPLDPTELKRLQNLLPKERPKKPIAFAFGHGLWNDMDLQATVNWLQGILDAMYEAAPYLRPENLPREGSSNVAEEGVAEARGQPLAHVLFVTPSAAGVLKPDQWILTQGDKALQVFETSMHNLIHQEDGRFFGKGVEHLGTWNMSIQMDKWDGVHLNLRGNLLKAMGLVNWLGGIEVEKW